MTRRPTSVVLLFAIVTVAGWFLFWPIPWLQLELTDVDGKRHTQWLAIDHDEAFAVRFIHSVELRPVIEYFTLDRSGDVVLTGTRYHGFGAGLPTDPGEGIFAMEGDALVISGLSRKIGQLRIRLHPMNEYTVMHRRRAYRWPDAQAGARLTIGGIRAGRLAVWITGALEGGT